MENEQERKPKKHRQKRSYTLQVISGNPDADGKQFHFTPGQTQALAYAGFIVLLLLICYVIYSAISLHSLRALQARQSALTQELRSQNAILAATNNALQNEVSQLSRAFNQKLEAEQLAEEAAHALTIPLGFPLSGAAAMSNDTVSDENDVAEPILRFTGIEVGSAVIATGDGTVRSVERDATYGYQVIIDHNDGYASVYYNGGVPVISAGDTVQVSQELFRIAAGNATLGYQVMLDGVYIDPETLLEING